jgi:hypothetical protein
MGWPRRAIATNRSVKRLYSWKDVKGDIKKMKVQNWKVRVQDRTKWKGVVEKIKTLREL